MLFVEWCYWLWLVVLLWFIVHPADRLRTAGILGMYTVCVWCVCVWCVCVWCVCVWCVCVCVCVCVSVGPMVPFITALVLELNKTPPTDLLCGALNYLEIFRGKFGVTPVVVAAVTVAEQ